jgi:hypothetical protein
VIVFPVGEGWRRSSVATRNGHGRIPWEEIVQVWSYIKKAVLVSAVAGFCAIAPAPGVRAQDAIAADAQSVLAAMSNYLGGLQSFSVEFDAVDEIVSPEGQKLQFFNFGEIAAQRPDKLYADRRGAAGGAEMFLDGKALTIYAKEINAYLQLDASSIDATIDALHKVGFDAPGADLLASKPLDSATTDMTSGAHIGMTFIDGVEVHHLAFRGANVDWQLWVGAGDKPLPLRYVVTTKWFTGAPQYTLRLRNWNTSPQIDAARFAFAPPQDAKKLDSNTVSVNAIGEMTIKGE